MAKKSKGKGAPAAPKAGRALKRGAASTLPSRVLPEGKKPGHFRSASKIRLLKMYNSKPEWLKGSTKKKHEVVPPARIEPDRRWFGNTRVIDQQKLADFREEVEKASKDPYTVILRRSKLPMGLIKDGNTGGVLSSLSSGASGEAAEVSRQSTHAGGLLAVEPFDSVFAKGGRSRKRPRLMAADLASLAAQAAVRHEKFETAEAEARAAGFDAGEDDVMTEQIFKKGTSKRIWGELYKVVDSSDVLVQVVDARDPLGTRCKRLEKYIREHRSAKHMLLILNKVDLIPAGIAREWLRRLSKECPTLLLQADKENAAAGRQQFLQVLRQYGQLMRDKKHVSVGFFGYPNVGKSSIINFLLRKKVCKAAPVPGETRVWQYVSLTNKIYLIDCPGVVPDSEEAGDASDKAIRGVVRPERIQAPEEHIPAVLQKVKREAIAARYGIDFDCESGDAEEFLTILARNMGKLKKGGEPNLQAAARIVLYDLQRGRLPYYVPPPNFDETSELSSVSAEGSGGAARGDSSPIEAESTPSLSGAFASSDGRLHLEGCAPCGDEKGDAGKKRRK